MLDNVVFTIFHYSVHSMASSFPLHQTSFFSKTQVHFTSLHFPFHLFLHLFLLSNLNELLTNVCLLSKQFKGLRHGYLWRPSYSFGSCAENKVQPVKASVETARFPLFQPPKDDETASQVKTHFAPCLFINYNTVFGCCLFIIG